MFFLTAGDSIARSSTAEGADVDVEFADEFRMYAVKSGTAVFNAASWKKQLDNFSAARLRMAKTKKRFDGVVAYGYGRNPAHSGAREVAGQALWEELSGDPTFYLRIMRAMRSGSQERQTRFQVEYEKAVSRFLRELLANFASEDGALDWEKLLAYNSATDRPNPKDWQKG